MIKSKTTVTTCTAIPRSHRNGGIATRPPPAQTAGFQTFTAFTDAHFAAKHTLLHTTHNTQTSKGTGMEARKKVEMGISVSKQ